MAALGHVHDDDHGRNDMLLYSFSSAVAMHALRLIIIDDNATFLRAATAFLETCPNLSLVGLFESGIVALEHVRHLLPDMVLVDIDMPEMNGIEVTRRMKQLDAPPKIIVLTMHNLPMYRTAVIAAGADGFLTKEAFTTGIIALIQQLSSQH